MSPRSKGEARCRASRSPASRSAAWRVRCSKGPPSSRPPARPSKPGSRRGTNGTTRSLTYTRTRALRYTGAESSPGGFAPEYSTATEPTFSAGETTVAGFRFYKAASTTLLVTEGGREGSGTFTVKPASAASVSLAFNPAEATVGTGDELTVKALDPYGNLATTSYANGVHTLTFGGAANGPAGAEPRVTDRTGTAKPFGQPTEIEFSGAEAHVEAGRNGLMTLYSAEEAHVTVTDGSLKNGVSGQPIKVKAGEAKSFRASGPAPAEPEAGQAFNVTITALDAGGNIATGYGGAGGQNKTLAYSGPAASPSGKAPEYPGSATTVNFREGVGTATAIKLYHAGANTLTAKEGTIEGSVVFTVKAGRRGSLQALRPGARRTRSRARRSTSPSRRSTAAGTPPPSYGGAVGQNKTIAYSGPECLALREGARNIPRGDHRQLQRRRRHGDRIKLYQRRHDHAHGQAEGTLEGSTGFSRQGRSRQELRRHADPRGTAGRQAFEVKLAACDEFHNALTGYTRTHKLVYSGAESSRERQGAGILHHHRTDLQRGRSDAHRLPLLQGRGTTLKVRGRNERPRRPGDVHGQGRPRGQPQPRRAQRPPNPNRPGVQRHFHRARRRRQHRPPATAARAGRTRRIAYSGPGRLALGQGARIPGPATTVNFREGVGTATAIKLYHAGTNTLTAKEGTIEGSVAFTVKTGPSRASASRRTAGRTPGRPGIRSEARRMGRIPQPAHQLHAHAQAPLLGRRSLAAGKAPEYATTTEPTFNAGEATLTGFHFYKAAATTLKVAEETTSTKAARA